MPGLKVGIEVLVAKKKKNLQSCHLTFKEISTCEFEQLTIRLILRAHLWFIHCILFPSIFPLAPLLSHAFFQS